MLKKILVIAVLFVSSVFAQCTKEVEMSNVSKFKVNDMDNKLVSLEDYKGKVLLVVNVASKCGYTKQYSGLQELYSKYKDKGFEILAFPCNDFANQEPGTNEEIKEFCGTNFNVTFKLFDKIKVLGEDKAPLYSLLTDNKVTGKGDIKWNFEKFLISKTGDIIARFPSKVEPMSEEIVSQLEKELKN